VRGSNPPPGTAVDQTRRGVGQDVVVTFGGRLALTAVILVSDVVLARVLGPEGKGAFLLVLVFSQLAALIVGLGLDRSLAVFAARSEQVARRAFANVALWTLLLGAVGVVAVYVLYGPVPGEVGGSGPLAPLLPPLTEREFLLGALALPGELAFGIGLVGLLGRERVLAYNALRLLRRGVLLVLLLALLALGTVDLELVLVFNLVALALTAAGIIWAAARARMVGFTPSPKLLGEQLWFGSRTVVGALAERLHFRADAFLLNMIVGVGATGVYSVALGLAETLWYLPAALGLVLFSRAVRPGVDSGGIAASMTRSMLALSVLAAIPLAVAAPTLVEIVYGPPFRDAGLALQVMLPGVIAYSVVAILSHYIIAAGAPGTATAVLIAGLMVNLAANVVLIPQFGLIGAAAAASISYSATALLTVAAFRRLSGRSFAETLLVRRRDVGARASELRSVLGRMRAS
jgi:O-antigen/teichoic acid export membrane protein